MICFFLFKQAYSMTCVLDNRGSYTEASCDGACVLDPARLSVTHVGDCQIVGTHSNLERGCLTLLLYCVTLPLPSSQHSFPWTLVNLVQFLPSNFGTFLRFTLIIPPQSAMILQKSNYKFILNYLLIGPAAMDR